MQRKARQPLTTPRLIIIGVAIFVTLGLLYYLRSILTYVLIAWVISMIGRPVVKIFRKIQIGKMQLPMPAAAGLTLLLFAVIIGSFFAFFVPMFVHQANNLSKIDYNAVGHTLQTPLDDLTARGKKFGFLNENETALSYFEHEFSKYIDVTRLGGTFKTAISAVGGIFVGFFAVLFISFFFLKDQNMFMEFISSFFPQERDQSIREAIDGTTTMLTRYFTGILIQMFFIFIYQSIVLSVLGVENAFLIAIFAAIINIVPYLGPWLGCIFALMVAISSNLNVDFYAQTVPLLVKIIMAFGAMQLLNDWFVSPVIFSNRVKAHPLEIFLVTLIGAELGGILGMVIAIPTYTVLRVVAHEFFNQYRFVQNITRGLEINEQ